MSEVANLLNEIGKDLGRTPEQMAPLVKKLEDQWWGLTIFPTTRFLGGMTMSHAAAA